MKRSKTPSASESSEQEPPVQENLYYQFEFVVHLRTPDNVDDTRTFRVQRTSPSIAEIWARVTEIERESGAKAIRVVKRIEVELQRPGSPSA